MRRLSAVIAMLALLAGCSAEPTEPAFNLQEVKEFLDLNFSGTVWYSSVQELAAPGGGRLNVITNLYPDDEGREFANRDCRVILVNTSPMGVTDVAVFGQEDKLLALCP